MFTLSCDEHDIILKLTFRRFHTHQDILPKVPPQKKALSLYIQNANKGRLLMIRVIFENHSKREEVNKNGDIFLEKKATHRKCFDQLCSI